MRFSGIFVVSSLIVSAFALPARTFAPTIESLAVDLKTFTTMVQNSNGSPSQVDGIHNAAVNMAKKTAKANSDLQNYPSFDRAECRENIVASEALVSGIEALCNSFIEKKTSFKNEQHVTIKMDMKQVAVPSYMLADSLVKLTTNIDRPKAIELQMRAMKAFGKFLNEF